MNKQTINKVLHYIGRYKILMVLSIIFAAISVALTLYIPILVGKAIDHIIAPGKVDFESIMPILMNIGAAAVITAIVRWLMNTINNKVVYQVIRDIRNQAIEKIQTLPLSYLDSHQYGEVVNKVISDVDQFADGLLMGFTQLFTGVVTIIGTLIFMLTIHPLITLVVVVLTPISLFVAKFIATHTHDMFKLQSETRAEQTALVEEVLANQKVVQAFCHEDESIEEFEEINDRLQKTSLKATFFSSLTNPCTRFVNAIVYAGVALFGALGVIGGGLTVGGLTCFLSYANQYTKPFNEISGVITELQNAFVCANRVFTLIEEESEVADIENAYELTKAEGKIKADHVDFSYNPEVDLIKDLNLDVKAGQRIAIVGPTGCGKTTIINLLMRFYDVNAGAVSVDDVDIREMSRQSLRSNYGMVLQETWLRAGTIKENIGMGKPDATDAEIIAAAKACHAHGFISRMENGYDTYIGEDGGNLSQGQRQLLCIARIMLRRPPMLILDEATSSIDTRTEILIQDAFAELMRGRTSFIVAHRLSTIKNADLILVMNSGKIIEKGTHSELLAKRGFYYEMYKSMSQ